VAARAARHRADNPRDDLVFDRFFEAFDRGPASDQAHMVEFLPLNGFESNEDGVLLLDVSAVDWDAR
jgi:hypothetical protein